jgi:hypothetical protein
VSRQRENVQQPKDSLIAAYLNDRHDELDVELRTWIGY